MTEGTPWKVILRFSIPVLMGNLFQQLYSLADAMIIGRLVGVYPLAGVGAAAAMSFLVLGFATGLTGGFSVVTAQRAGQGDPEKIKESAAASMVLCVVTAVLLTVLSVATAVPLLKFMNTPEEIFPYARTYIRITYLGLGAVLYYNLMAGLLLRIGRQPDAPLFSDHFICSECGSRCDHDSWFPQWGGRCRTCHRDIPACLSGRMPSICSEAVSGIETGKKIFEGGVQGSVRPSADRSSDGTSVFRDSSRYHDPAGVSE